MSFKENLLRKISLDHMRRRVLATLGPMGGGGKIDKRAMRELLSAAGFECTHMRGLELYFQDAILPGEIQPLLVLDNDLPLYHSTVEDVAMRKEPSIKEMISIRNALRILNDADVVVSRKEGSLAFVYEGALARLDLSFDEADIKNLVDEGRAGLDGRDAPSVREILGLFGELLNLDPAPAPLRLDGHDLWGRVSTGTLAGECFGPAVVYSPCEGILRWVDERVELSDPHGVERFLEKARGTRDADLFGASVMIYLGDEVMRGQGPGVPPTEAPTD